MQEKTHRCIDVVKLLQSGLDASAHLDVMSEGAYFHKAHFSFGNPTSPADLQHLSQRWPLPESYTEFLTHHNGATLYEDNVYSQWGFRLYNTDEIVTRNEEWARLYAPWPSSYFVFAECLGDADILLFDLSRSFTARECVVIDGDTGYPPDTWKVIARSFVEWLDHLLTRTAGACTEDTASNGKEAMPYLLYYIYQSAIER